MKDDEFQPLDPGELEGIDPAMGLDELLIFGSLATRRHFLKQVAGTSAAISLGPALVGMGTVQAAADVTATPAGTTAAAPVRLKINGKEHTLTLDPRTTL